MKNRTKWFLIAGLLCIGFSLPLKYFLKEPDMIGDFLKGMGLPLIIAALLSQRKPGGNEQVKKCV